MTSILTSQRLKQLSSFPLLKTNWYYLTAATLSVCNAPNEIPVLFTYLLDEIPANDNKESQSARFKVAQQIRETILKSAALGGLPKAINSLMQLKNVTPVELRETVLQRQEEKSKTDRLAKEESEEGEGKATKSTPESAESLDSRGTAFFDQVYGKINKRVLGQMSTAYPDLGYWALQHVYGPLLSYTGILGPKETSLVVIASLIPQDVNPQLKGHLKGALNNGATKEEVMQVRELAMLIASWCGVTWKAPVAKL